MLYARDKKQFQSDYDLAVIRVRGRLGKEIVSEEGHHVFELHPEFPQKAPAGIYMLVVFADDLYGAKQRKPGSAVTIEGTYNHASAEKAGVLSLENCEIGSRK